MTRPGPLNRGVYDGINTPNQLLRRGLVAQAAGQPFHRLGSIVEAAAIAGGSIPAAQPMSRGRKVPNQIPAQKAGGPRYGNEHGNIPEQE
jgi:hypothetical protein